MPQKMDHSPCQCQTYTHTLTHACHFVRVNSNLFLHLSSLSHFFLLFSVCSSLFPSSSFHLSGQRRPVLYGERLIFPPFPSLTGILTESWLYGNKENCSLTTEGEGEQNLSYMLWQTLVEKLQ